MNKKLVDISKTIPYALRHKPMEIICEAVAIEELADEDWKTQAARKYPNIPKGSVVYVLQEDYYNFYGGPWTRVEWKKNWYWVSSDKIKKLKFMPI